MKRIIIDSLADDETITSQDLGLVNELKGYASWWAKDPTGAARFDSDVEVWVNGLIYRRGEMVGNYDGKTNEATYYNGKASGGPSGG